MQGTRGVMVTYMPMHCTYSCILSADVTHAMTRYASHVIHVFVCSRCTISISGSTWNMGMGCVGVSGAREAPERSVMRVVVLKERDRGRRRRSDHMMDDYRIQTCIMSHTHADITRHRTHAALACETNQTRASDMHTLHTLPQYMCNAVKHSPLRTSLSTMYIDRCPASACTSLFASITPTRLDSCCIQHHAGRDATMLHPSVPVLQPLITCDDREETMHTRQAQRQQ